MNAQGASTFINRSKAIQLLKMNCDENGFQIILKADFWKGVLNCFLNDYCSIIFWLHNIQVDVTVLFLFFLRCAFNFTIKEHELHNVHPKIPENTILTSEKKVENVFNNTLHLYNAFQGSQCHFTYLWNLGDLTLLVVDLKAEGSEGGGWGESSKVWSFMAEEVWRVSVSQVMEDQFWRKNSRVHNLWTEYGLNLRKTVSWHEMISVMQLVRVSGRNTEKQWNWRP